MNRHLTLALALLLTGAPALAQESQPQGPSVPADLELYSEASLMMHRQEHEKARALLGRLLAEHPHTAVRTEAMFWQAHCLEELGRPEEARRAYRSLLASQGDSGWAHDARRRIKALEEGVRSRAATARALKIHPGQQTHTLVLANGDRISGRVLSADGTEVQVLADGLGRVTMPRAGITQIYRVKPSPVRSAWSVRTTHDSGREAMILSLLAGDEDEILEIDDGDKTTVVEDDGTRTTTTLHPDGSKTVTRIRTTKDGRKIVTVEKTSKKDSKKKRRIELELDGDDFDFDQDLRDLPRKLRLRIKKKLDGLNLEDLDFDFDFDGLKGLDDLKELRELKGLKGLKGLEGLPRRIREEIAKGLGAGKGKHRRILRLHDEDGPVGEHEEQVFILRGKDGERHINVLKRVGEKAKRLGEHAKTFTRRLHLGDGPNVYRFGDGGEWVGGGAGEHDFFFGGESRWDRVFLRNGDKISGTLLRVTETHVEMKTSYGEVKIDRGQVRQIKFKGKKTARTKVLRRQRRRGDTTRPHLGIILGKTDGGVLVSEIQEGTAAERAGLKKGDVIRSLGGKTIASIDDLRRAMGTHKVGETVELVVTRGDSDTLKLSATLGAARGVAVPRAPRPPKAPLAPGPDRVAPPAPPAPPKPERPRSRQLRRF